MTATASPDAGARRPRLAPHVRLHFDRRREQWVLQAPERVIVLDSIAAEIVQRCDGTGSQQQIVDGLAAEFDAPPDEIEDDVARLIEQLCARGVLLI